MELLTMTCRDMTMPPAWHRAARAAKPMPGRFGRPWGRCSVTTQRMPLMVRKMPVQAQKPMASSRKHRARTPVRGGARDSIRRVWLGPTRFMAEK